VADINVERKQGPGIWPWIIGIIILALIVWWLFARGRNDRAENVTSVDTTAMATDTGAMAGAAGATAGAAAGGAMATMPGDTMGGMGAGATGQGIPVPQILANPGQYDGQSVSGTDSVVEVVSDRGFWIEQQGKRLFVAMAEPQPDEKVMNVNAGQKVRLTGTVHQGGANANPPFKLEAKAQKVIAAQPVYLTSTYKDVAVATQ